MSNTGYTQSPVGVIVQTATIPPVGPGPVHMVCPSCNHTIDTRTTYEINQTTHIWALVTCLCLCWLCVPCIYLCNCCKSVSHNCPHCGAYIGTYEK